MESIGANAKEWPQVAGGARCAQTVPCCSLCMKRTTVLPLPDRDRMRFSNAFRDSDQASDNCSIHRLGNSLMDEVDPIFATAIGPS